MKNKYPLTGSLIALLLVVMFFFVAKSCKQKSIKYKIADRLEEKCKGDTTCFFNMAEVTNFKWDKFYLFGMGISLDSINKALGFEYPYYEELTDYIVFVYRGNIVYHEGESVDPESKPMAGIIFECPIDTVFDFNNANFHVKILVEKGTKYYELYPVKQ